MTTNYIKKENKLTIVTSANLSKDIDSTMSVVFRFVVDSGGPVESSRDIDLNGFIYSVVGSDSSIRVLLESERIYRKPSPVLPIYFGSTIGSNTNSDNVNFVFSAGGSSEGTAQYIYHGSTESLTVGVPSVWNWVQEVKSAGFNLNNIGNLWVKNQRSLLLLKGFNSEACGKPSVRNRNQTAYPSGTLTQLMGMPLVYNLTQYRVLRGYDASLYGIAYIQGGVKYLYTGGVDSAEYGAIKLVNTTANQTVTPVGIDSAKIPIPGVSPRIIYPVGMYQFKAGTLHIYDPSVRPVGEVHTTYGVATAWYHTRPITPAGVDSFDTGYPNVFDPSQEVQTPSIITSAIFGDTAIRNERRFVQTSSIFDGVVEQWAVVTNTNRYYAPAGIDSQLYGDTDIRNKTPSVFVDGIPQTEIGYAAVGYAIRTVAPSGFDRLLLGRPLLTKSPELAPKSFNTSIVSNLFISHRIRAVRPVSFIATLFGSHVAWYRYRYVSPMSWLSSKFGTAHLTHGVREVIAQGFVREVHGILWISQGTRHIEPIGINKIYPTLQMVGGSREVKLAGFIATEFGTRIIPENIYAYPQGFAGTFGLSAVRLNTQHLRPLGFISVGQQPADRWGYAKTYNLSQYIIQVQNFDRNNGLIPPAWSEWTLIENRDKQLNATGLGSLRFGYSKIDNNAAPLLPLGIAPPVSTRYDVSLIAHGVRYIKPDGLDAPAVSSWLAIYNDARVVAAQGFNDTGLGLAAVKNTRRYYSGVGRFESSEYGEPMISHAIRNISLEPRYAIMPPQINLPVIDVWTKYATFRGFETAAYGTPSLDIRFNIIAPKWVYRYNMGDPYIKNLTPELGLYGHDSNEFGVSSVRTQWRKVYADGDTLTLFGLAKIADTKQFIGLRGWQDMVASQKHTVIKTGAPPYSEQKISLDGGYDFEKDEAITGYGISSDKTFYPDRIPKPGINQNVIYAEGYEATLFGGGRVWSNNIQILSGIAIHNISSGHAVYNKTREVILEEADAIKSQIEVGSPRLSPWTIYAVNNAPEQAIVNHPSDRLHYVNSDSGRKSTGIIVGYPKVESTIRTVSPRWSMPRRDSNHRVDLVRRVIKPPSFGARKFGIPSIPFTDQVVQVFEVNDGLSSLFGKPDIITVDKGDKHIGGRGFNALGMGYAEVQLYTRELLAKGKDSLAMGERKQNDKPYMWQGLRVGAHVPLVIGGDDMSAFGEGMVSLRIRGIELEGWESFISEYDTANFNKRMKVSHARQPDMQSQRVSIDGFIAADYGNADFKFGQYFIKPDGNSNQFRKGGYHA